VWPGSTDALGPGVARHGVVVTASIGEALDELVHMDRVKRGGVVRSIKRLFGKQ
jgi:3-oxoacyl-[acyl-carrier-protein] synthase III